MRKFVSIVVVLLSAMMVLGMSGCMFEAPTPQVNVTVTSACSGSCPNPAWAPQPSASHHTDRNSSKRISDLEDRTSENERQIDATQQRVLEDEDRAAREPRQTIQQIVIVDRDRPAPPPQVQYEQPAPQQQYQQPAPAPQYQDDGYVPYQTPNGALIMIAPEEYGECDRYYRSGGRMGRRPEHWRQPREREPRQPRPTPVSPGNPPTKGAGNGPGGGGGGSSPAPVGPAPGPGQPGRFSVPSRGGSFNTPRAQSGGFRSFAGNVGRSFSSGARGFSSGMSRGGGGRR